MTITDIVTKIDRRLVEARAEQAHLQGARAALVNGAPPTTATRRPKAAGRRPAKPARHVVPAGKLTAVLSGSPGMRTRELSRATGGDPAQILALLKQQESAGQVRRTGTRAATRWHAITDEQRIATRAAELNARSRHTRARKT